MKLKWWCFNQNNSGGSFEVNSHVAEYVFVQAPNWNLAETIMQKIVDEHSHMGSCPCCGDRWSWWQDEDDGENEPMIYGKPFEEHQPVFSTAECRLHFLDGTITGHTLTRNK